MAEPRVELLTCCSDCPRHSFHHRRLIPELPIPGSCLHYLGSRCFWPKMTSRASSFEFLHQHQRLRERGHFLTGNELSPTRHQLGLSQILKPKNDQVRAKNKVLSRLSRKEIDVQGHSRDSASMFKSKVLGPARRTAHPGPHY